MTAQELVIKRTGMSQEDADFYVELASERVRTYLHLDSEADLSAYTFQIADIAVLYWQRDQSTVQSQATLGYNRESFQEGNVRHTIANMTGSAIYATYDEAVIAVLATLDGMDGIVTFI